MAVLKLQISNEQIAEAFFEDSFLLGIHTTLKYYRFIWEANRILGFQFRTDAESEVVFKNDRGRDYRFDIYASMEPMTKLCHYVYLNKSDGEYLLPQLKNFDLMWLVKGESLPEMEDRELLRQAIRSLPEVLHVVELLPAQVKDKQRLIF